MESNIINVEIITHKKTGLLLAISSDMPGLYVHGRTFDDLDQNILIAIKSILEAEGKTKVKVLKAESDGAQASEFAPSNLVFNTIMASAS